MNTIFVTGATGLLGGGVLQRMLRAEPELKAFVLVRSLPRWMSVAGRQGLLDRRVTPVVGDITVPGLRLAPEVRAQLSREVTAVLHFAAEITFSLPLPESRAANVDGTRHVLELAEAWPRVRRFIHASTSFVAGRHTGRIPERDNGPKAGWVNAYEQSKYEAEHLVRSGTRLWVIFRPTMVVFDAAAGIVRQFNVVHRSLRLYYGGLASVLPGEESTRFDAVPDDYVNGAIAQLALREHVTGQTLHLCSGEGALSLGEMLDITYGIWGALPAWQRKGIRRPELVDLDSYRRLEQSVRESGDPRVKQVTESLAHFTSQLAYPKSFDTTVADSALGYAAPPVRSYWGRMIRYLLESNWAAAARAAA